MIGAMMRDWVVWTCKLDREVFFRKLVLSAASPSCMRVEVKKRIASRKARKMSLLVSRRIFCPNEQLIGSGTLGTEEDEE